jgi:hypothetical protein
VAQGMRKEEIYNDVFIQVLDTGRNLGALSLMVRDSNTALVYVDCGCMNFIEIFPGKV